MTRISDKTVLITGGASGIGALMAKICLKKKASKVILLDMNAEALKAMKSKLSEYGEKVHTLQADITNTEELHIALDELKKHKISIEILINNAGVVTGKKFAEHQPSDIDKNMQVNSIAPMKLTLALLPELMSRKTSHIVNISSAASMLSNTGMSVYCASKWAMTGWSDSLRLEMERDHTGVRVLTVTPYYIDTGMFKGVRSPVIPILKPEKVAASIVNAIEKNKIILRTPWIVYTLPFMKGILPKRWLDVIVGKYFGVYKSMYHFTGRNYE